MLSIRLWRSMADATIDDPILQRVSRRRNPAPSVKRRRLPRFLGLLAALAYMAGVVHSPGLLVALLIVPIMLIMLMVATPLLLPLYVWVAGIQVTADVIGGIYREKRQRTYDLICTSTRGALDASWSCAAGALHRCEWFMPLRWGTARTLRAGLALLGGLSVFALLGAVSGGQAVGYEQTRILLLVTLLLALYYSNMIQTLALSLVVGLYFSSFELSRYDSTLIGLFGYVMLSLLPVLAGALVLVAGGRALVEPPAVDLMAVEILALLLVVGLREAGVMLMWRGLRRRLAWGREIASRREIATTDQLWEAA